MKIGIGVVHNNNEKRNEILFPNIEKLKNTLEKEYDVKTEFVSEQPEITLDSIHLTIKKRFYFWKLFRKWNDYKYIKNISVIKSFLAFIKDIIKDLMFDRETISKKSFLENVITRKHVKAWSSLFDDKDIEYFIICEDDAIFFEDSFKKIEELIVKLNKNTKDSFCFVDLAGGGKHDEEMHYENLKDYNDKNFVYYKKLVTRTACSYLINRKLMEFLVNIASETITSNYIGIDWQINEWFIELEKRRKDEKKICFHTEPTILKHGSFFGYYNTWQKY